MIIIKENCITITNSFAITNDKEKWNVLNQLFLERPELEKTNRTKQNMFWEWKAHNILYQKKFKQERTQIVDFELNQKCYLKIAYWLIAHLFKEEQV